MKKQQHETRLASANKAKFHDYEYLDRLHYILHHGEVKDDRTGTGTLSTFGPQMSFNLRGNSVPLLTTKRMFTKSIKHELIWYLKGESNIRYLSEQDVHIWDAWADDNGDLGPVYPTQWRNLKKPESAKIDYNFDPPRAEIQYSFVDQIANVIEKLRTNPTDRRIIVSAWNVSEIDDMNLPPCHALFQFWSNGKGELRCKLYQRSADIFLGVPFNISQYSILTHMIAQVTGHTAVEFIWSGGDVHLYSNHIEQANIQLERKPLASPTLTLNPKIREIDDFGYDDIQIINYSHHSPIPAPVAV